MRIPIAVFAVSVLGAGAAYAQSSPAPSRGYAEVVAQSAFGNVTSQSFGGEVGVGVTPSLQVFVEGGLVRDAAPASLGANAQKIAAAITTLAGNGAAFHVKQPVTFGIAGLKYVVPTSSSRVAPYVLVGGGAASVKRDVTFTTPSGDITQFVTLGSDLTGRETAGMLSLGGGVGLPLGSALIIDLQYRFGRLFTSGEGQSINRAGVGVGVRF